MQGGGIRKSRRMELRVSDKTYTRVRRWILCRKEATVRRYEETAWSIEEVTKELIKRRNKRPSRWNGYSVRKDCNTNMESRK